MSAPRSFRFLGPLGILCNSEGASLRSQSREPLELLLGDDRGCLGSQGIPTLQVVALNVGNPREEFDAIDSECSTGIDLGGVVAPVDAAGAI